MDRANANENKRAEAMAGIHDIPIELVTAILLEWTPQKWRFCVRPVCAQWKCILDRDGDHDPPMTKRADWHVIGNDALIPWSRLLLHLGSAKKGDNNTRNHRLRCKWRRGTVVLASAAVSWCAVRSAVHQESPQALVDWCTAVAGNGFEPAMVAAVLIAARVPELAHHAIRVLLPTTKFEDESQKGRIRNVWYGCMSGTDAWLRKWDVQHYLAYHLSRMTHLDTIRVLLPHLDTFDWAHVACIDDMLESSNVDVARFFLEQWRAANPHRGSGGIWHSPDVEVIGNVLALMGAPSPGLSFVDPPFGRNSWDDEFGSAGDCALRENDDVSRCAGLLDRGHLAEWLSTLWKREGCCDCAINAALYGHVGILEMVEPYMSNTLRRKVFRAACRCAQIEVVEWCLRSWRASSCLDGITMSDALSWATHPYVDEDGHRPGDDPSAFVDWIFDPKGGAHVATLDEIRRLSADSIDCTCALWFVENCARDIAALGPPVMRAFVARACLGDHGWRDHCAPTARALERIVRALDDYADIALACGAAPFECDLWSIIVPIVREQCSRDCRFNVHAPVRYAWARVTGQEDAALEWMGDTSNPLSPIESWKRWCKPVPLTARQIWMPTHELGAKRCAGNMMCWLAAKGLLVTHASDPVDLVTLGSTVPDQDDNDYGDKEWSNRMASLRKGSRDDRDNA